MIKQKSAGAIVFYEQNNKREYLLVCGGKNFYWGFPKGWVEETETPERTAMREIKEEVDLDVELIPGFEEKISFFFKDKGDLVYKEVIFYLAKAKSKNVNLSYELKDYIWLDFDNAYKKLSYNNLKEVLKKAEEYLNSRA
ncbi:MAG: NUDIX domain-containing protein [Candidatus Anstonellales archaeon]